MTANEIRDLPLDRILFVPQVRERFEKVALAELAESLAAVGLQQPIRVIPEESPSDPGGSPADGHEGRYRILDGERRAKAAALAGWISIPAIVETVTFSPAETIQRQLICNTQRADLLPTERARAVEKLIRETGCTASQAAKLIGKSGPTVSKWLSLLLAPEAVRRQVDEGTVGTSTAYAAVKTRDAKKRKQVFDELSRGKVTRDEVEKRVRGQHARAAGGKAAVARRKRVRFPLAAGCEITASVADSLTVGILQEALTRFLERVRALSPSSRLSEVAAALEQAPEVRQA